ncbi:protein-glutamate methylesterase/protein-glutamine glutaminase [Sporosarcina sp. CAU 1771]
MRKLISDFLNSHPMLEVIGTARNGKDALEKIRVLKPDVVTLDIEMPIMNGLEALQEIMSKHPLPVVMLSSTTEIGAENTMLAMEYGAVDFIAKPGGAISLNLRDVEDEIIEKVVAASGVQISKLSKISIHNSKNELITEQGSRQEVEESIENRTKTKKSSKEVSRSKSSVFSKLSKTFVIIGTSTGGPRALQQVLTKLPADFDRPILIVQHMPPGFTKSLADRLNGLCEISVKEAENGELLLNGTAYIAPGGKHLKLKKLGASYFVHLDESESPRAGHRPSVDVLLESAAELSEVNYVTVIMTGMGSDGKVGMELLRRTNKTITIAESAKTSVVFGMPRVIIDAGFADQIEDIQDIPNAILKCLKF